MSLLSRLIPVCVALICCVHTSSAFSQQATLPREAELNRLGLSLAWWAQASMNPRQDKLEFFSADEHNVYVQASSGIVSSFHAEQGKKLWAHLIGQPNLQSYPVTTSDQEVLITVGLQLHALRKDTGRKLWQLTCPEYPSTSPEIDDKYIFIGTLDGSVLAYDLARTKSLYRRGMLPQWTVRARLWNFQTPDRIVSPPIASGDNVIFASERGSVYGLRSQNKEMVFQLETGTSITTPLGHSQDKLFVADRNARLLCLDIHTGKVIWTFAGGTPIGEQPRVVDRHVFIVPHREGLFALNSATGMNLWHHRTANAIVAVSETRVYASDDSHRLLVLDRETGNELGVLNLRNFPIRVANDRTDRLFLASPTGTLLALREVGSAYPNYHLFPDRRPILPEFAPEEDTADVSQ